MAGSRFATAFCVALAIYQFGAVADALGSPPEADQAWQTILEQAGGPGTQFRSQTEALASARQHLDKQEAALRDFVARFSSDGHRYSAQIRLSGVLRAKAKLTAQPKLREEAEKILSNLSDDPAIPAPVKSDAGFAQVSQQMEDASGYGDKPTRDALMQCVRRFDASFPHDRRTPGLLAEVATLYDSEPQQKRLLLNEAQSQATDGTLRLRIADDLKRLDLLGKPLELQLQFWQSGTPVELASRRGHVVVLLFWASWSGPALRELATLLETARRYSGRPVEFFAVSLDEDRTALANTIKAADLRWPVHCDGLGWKGGIVKSLGINALPTVFVLDRGGKLTALNACGGAEDEIERALKP